MVSAALWIFKRFFDSSIGKSRPNPSFWRLFTATKTGSPLLAYTSNKINRTYFSITSQNNIETGYRPTPLWRSALVDHCRYSSTTMDHSAHSETGEVSLFQENKDSFECIVLDLRKSCHQCEESKFKLKMNESVRSWKDDGVRGVTVYVPTSLCSRIQILVELGFDFHHAKPGYVLMLMWLSQIDGNNFPSYANQYLGVGGFVVNDNNELLVIRERFTGVEARWKLPGGGADAGEELGVTAQREVFEETGIHSDFVGILCIRHQHQFRYGCSDFYFVCLMKATSINIQMCEQEILDCKWMTVEEFDTENLYPTNRFALDSYLKYKETGVLIQPNTIGTYTGKLFHTAYRPGKVGAPEQSVSNPGANSNL